MALHIKTGLFYYNGIIEYSIVLEKAVQVTLASVRV